MASVFSCTGCHFFISCEETVLYLILSMCISQIEHGSSTSRATRLWEKSLIQTQVSMLTQKTPAWVTGSVPSAKCVSYSFSHFMTYCISAVGIYSFTVSGLQRGFLKIFKNGSLTTARVTTYLPPPTSTYLLPQHPGLFLGHRSCSCSGCLTTADMWNSVNT